MKLFFSCLFFLGVFTFLNAQDFAEYQKQATIADSLASAQNYRLSAETYSKAFKAIGWRGSIDHRLGAANMWAMAGVPDSSFYQLFRLVDSAGYAEPAALKKETLLSPLRKDKRWRTVLKKAAANKAEEEKFYDRKLIKRLAAIYKDDQTDRLLLDSISKKFGHDSKELKDKWKIIERKDSLNLIQVRAILDKRGWLGPEVVGWEGSTTLFLVIQHADQQTQEQYLPMFREAVKNKKASPSSLALMEDRVALAQGKLQKYGSQIGQFKDTGKYYVLPLEDPDNVDKRREEMRLGPLKYYLENWDLTWDVEAYKKQLPELLELQKKRK